MDFDKPLSIEDLSKTWTLNHSNSLHETNSAVLVDRLDACAKLVDLDIYQKSAFGIIFSFFMLMYLEKDGFNLQPNYIVTEQNLLKRGARNQLIMFYQVLVDVKRVML